MLVAQLYERLSKKFDEELCYSFALQLIQLLDF